MLTPLLVLLLNKWTKMTASLVIVRPGLAVGMAAPRLVALPRHSLSRGGVHRYLDLPYLVT